MKRKNVELLTPVGTARYPHLNEPDRRFNDDGVFACDLILEANGETEAFMEKLMYEWTEAADYAKDQAGKANAKAANPPWAEEEDDEGGMTGRIILKTKLKHIVRPRNGTPWKKKVHIVDSQKNPMGEKVGPGSQLRLKIAVRGWFMPTNGAGASLDLIAAQVFELKQGGGAVDGFDVVEDGFTSEVAPEAFSDKVDETVTDASNAGTF